MRKILIFLIVVVLLFGFSHQVLAGDSFKFPKMIEYKLLKNDSIVGECHLLYYEKINVEGLSSLKIKNFQGFGLTSREWLYTYFFSSDSSIYASFVMEGHKPISEIRLKEGIGWDGKKEKLLLCKDLKSSDGIQIEIFPRYTVIDLLSIFYVTSKKVALGKKRPEKLNFLFGKEAKVVDMAPLEDEFVPFLGKKVPVDVFAVLYHNWVLFRFKIFKDKDGYYFPVSVMVTDFVGKEAFEMRAARISK